MRQVLRDGRIILGEIFSGGDLAAGDPGPTGFAAKMLARLAQRLPGVAGLGIDRINIGRRPVPAGGLPAIGALHFAPGIHVATMHSGVTLAALAGKLVAQEILGTDRSDMLASFRPGRFN